MGLDDYINNDKGNCYSGIDRVIYGYISDEQFAIWRKERLARAWHRRLWRWVTGLWRRNSDGD